MLKFLEGRPAIHTDPDDPRIGEIWKRAETSDPDGKGGPILEEFTQRVFDLPDPGDKPG